MTKILNFVNNWSAFESVSKSVFDGWIDCFKKLLSDSMNDHNYLIIEQSFHKFK